MTREGEEGAGVGEHANEVGEEPDGGEGVDLALHSLEGVVEPPAGTELDLALVGRFLEGAAGAGEDGVVARIEVVDDGLGKFSDAVEGIKEEDEGLALGPVADGVETGVGSKLFEEAGVGIATGSKVELHRPVFFGSPLADMEHDEGTEGVGIGRAGGGAGKGVAEDAVGLFFAARIGEGVAHPVIGEAAAFFVEEVETVVKDAEEFTEGGDISAEVIEPASKDLGAIDEEGFVGTEGGVDFGGTIGGVGDLVMGEIVAGIVGGADGIDAESAEKSPGGEVGFAEAFVGAVPDLFSGIGAQEGLDAEAAAEFEVGPIVEGIAEGPGDRFGVGLEFFAGGGVTGDVGFGDAIGPHGAPFVVVVSEPDFGDVVPALVVGHLLGRKMGVVIDDGLICRVLVEKSLCGVGEEEEVVVEVSSGHG